MLIRIIAIVTSLLLTACSKTVDTACTAFQPITYSASHDAVATVTQVRQHNAVWLALCR